MPTDGKLRCFENPFDNMETLARIDEAAQHYEAESKKAASLAQLKAQIAQVRAAIAKLEEVLK